MRIHEFLRARIVEDMDTAEHVIAHLEQLPHKPGGISVGGRDVYDLRRVVAECSAKAQIVEHCRPGNRTFANAATADQVLRMLASVYAGHPDYDPRWVLAG